MDGVINLNKPLGLTSNDAVVRVRRILGRGVKVGHGGTLDPQAQGVLPILIGRATRLFDVLLDKEKNYQTVLRFGQATDTQDATGILVEEQPSNVTLSELVAVLPRFQGEIWQTPPVYSAKKQNGQRLYRLAREGKAEGLEIPACKVQVHSLHQPEQVGPQAFKLEVCCGRGVYIRTLCVDIGKALGTCAHMQALTRTRCGRLTLDSALSLEDLEAAVAAGRLAECVHEMDATLDHLPQASADPSYELAIINGRPVPKEAVTLSEGVWQEGRIARLFCGEKLLALGRMNLDRIRVQALLVPSAGERVRE